MVSCPSEGCNSPLHAAAKHNRAGAVRALRNGGADPSALTAKKHTVLQEVVALGNSEAAIAVLEEGSGISDASFTSPGTQFALAIAARVGHFHTTNVFIGLGGNIHQVENGNNRSALHYAARHGRDQIVSHS